MKNFLIFIFLFIFCTRVCDGTVFINSFIIKPTGGGGISTSYANAGGTGERNSLVLVSSSASFFAGDVPMVAVDGSQGNDTWLTSGALSGSVYLRFDFGISRVIDEAVFYQSSATAQGTWKWQGSADASSWTDIGNSFSISLATDTLTELNGNTTAYRYYQMVGVSGSTSPGPYFREIEFKIQALPSSSTSYANTGGTGNRTSIITATTTLSWSGTFTNIINGNTTENNNWINGVAVSGTYIRFDFGSSKTIDEIKWYQDNASRQGIWKLQGSPDASSWTDIGNNFYLGSVATQSIYFPTSSTAYRYWQLIGISGNGSSTVYQREVEFKIQ